jgi:tetratricopeptide (TPR) repeat protein
MILEYKDAISDCDAALILDSSNSKAYFRKATALKNLGKFPDAIASLEKGLEFDPRSAAALADKAAMLSAQTKVADIKELIAMQQYQMALNQVEGVCKEIGNNFREINLLKVEALLALNRPEDAYNLSNLMVCTRRKRTVD